MGLSSNILWHQTDIDGFRGILESKRLLYSYSLETIRAGEEILVEAFPMISLSDLPFAELDFYLNCEKYDRGDAKFKTYGGYIFGFRREWGIRNKFSPVWYCETYHEGLCRIVANWKDNHGDVFLYHLIGNIKNNEGELPKANLDRYRFYNEREYRRLLDGGHSQTFTKDECEAYKKQHNGSSLLEPRDGIGFSVADIRYIIVPDDVARADFYRNQTGEWSLVKVFTRDEVNQNFIGIRHHHIKPAVDENKDDAVTQTISALDKPNDTAIKDADSQTYVENLNRPVAVPNLDIAAPVLQNIRTMLNAFAKTKETVHAMNEPFEQLRKTYDSFAKLTSFLDNITIKNIGFPPSADIDNPSET